MGKNSFYINTKFGSIQTSVAYDTYWMFAYKRQSAFIKRLKGDLDNLTDDKIIATYKFTNAYRACDRVSQFLIKEVIYSGKFNIEDLFIRIILFKLFNKIETWKLLEEKFGEISGSSFDIERIGEFLDHSMNNGRVLYSNAYMMASGSKEFKADRKHRSHLLLLNKMLCDRLPLKIAESKSMSEAYNHLLSYPLIGKFLAYQYVIDINYSELTEFSESEFTVPGPGARDGIRKCFSSYSEVEEADLIKLLYERQEYEFDRLGINFPFLCDRRLQYIDIQNLFCETDKYCRLAHPDIKGLSGRTKIKQKFRLNNEPIEYMFPPKWNIKVRDLYGY